MRLWKNVLVHLDAQRETPRALERSLRVAEAFCGRVIAFDCVEPGRGAPPSSHSTLRGDALELATATRIESLREELALLGAQVPVEAVVGEGSAGRALLGCARRSEADLIVKATSATDVRHRTASGRAAVHLLRDSPIPVWLHAGRPRGGPVVAVVDLSMTSPERKRLDQHVMLAASRLALLEHAELHVVCIADRARDRLFASFLRPAQHRLYLSEHRSDLRQSLEKLVAELGARPVPHLVEGEAEDALHGIVSELGADVVVLGRDSAHSRGGLPGGAELAECLLYRSERSVLLVAPEPASRRSRAWPPQREAGRATRVSAVGQT
jgi:nucleotide-binding universal stress UspA family protein